MTRRPLIPATRWWQALNAPIYLVSILPGMGVWQVVRPTDGALAPLVAATFAVVLLQHAINVLNDAADWRLGADIEKWDSWIRVHGEIRVAILHGWLSFLAGSMLGVLTLVSIDKLWILFFALPLVGLGYLYNSGVKPLSYTRLGEWVTGLCYGPGVFGCLWLVTSEAINRSTILGCIAFASLAVALLLSHQPPQILSDRQAGKQSFAARYGAVRTFQAVRVLFLIFLASWGLALANQSLQGAPTTLYWSLSCLAFAGTFMNRLGPKYLLLSSSILFAAKAWEALQTIR